MSEKNVSAAEQASVDRVVEKLYRLMLRANEFDARPRTFGIEDVLSRAEIHTVQAIGRAGETNMTKLAAALGVTKGAASQMAAKLAARALVAKTPNPKNGREVTLTLTSRGKRAYKAHEAFHREMAGSFREALGPDMEERLGTLAEAVDELIRVIDVHERRTEKY